jgi:hypothetical protein
VFAHLLVGFILYFDAIETLAGLGLRVEVDPVTGAIEVGNNIPSGRQIIRDPV